MRIALIHYSSLPVIAGVELVMSEHARLFGRAGHQVTVIADFASRPAMTAGQLVSELRPPLEAQDVAILHNVATMHFHLALTAALWQLADELPAVRFVCWIHDLAACNPDYAPLPLDRAPWNLLTQAHPRYTYIAVSELRRRQFLELTAQPPARCRTIPHGVDPIRLLDLPARVAALVEKHGLLDRDVILIHPARMLRRKNIELTLDVTGALKDAGHSCATLITAPPEIHHLPSHGYSREMRELRARLGLAEHVFFLDDSGALDERELQAIYRLADALWFPSRQEGFGLPILEAALHRLAIFCSDIEPLRDLLPGRSVRFSLETPAAKIAERIVQVLAGDPAHLARKEMLQTRSWDAVDRNFLSPLLAEIKTAPRP